jgi:hypothetical protein
MKLTKEHLKPVWLQLQSQVDNIAWNLAREQVLYHIWYNILYNILDVVANQLQFIEPNYDDIK